MGDNLHDEDELVAELLEIASRLRRRHRPSLSRVVAIARAYDAACEGTNDNFEACMVELLGTRKGSA